MVLLSSNAQCIYWLGRYITRTQYLCQCFPFQQDDVAVEFAHAFGLFAFDAVSLNELVLDDVDHPISLLQQFANIKNNIHELRGVLSASGYAELGQLIRQVNDKSCYICDVANDCYDIFEAEAQDIFLFFKLGHVIEQLDRQLRLDQDITETVNEIAIVVEQLKNIGWNDIESAWDALKNAPNNFSFSYFSSYVQTRFEKIV